MLETAFTAGLSPDAGQGDEETQTFLQAAAADGDRHMVDLALRFGAQVDKRNHRGETALGYACSWGHFPVVKLLVEAGAEINALETDPEDGISTTALDACTSASSTAEIGEYLRSLGAKKAHEL